MTIALQSSSLFFQKYGLKIDNKLTLVKGIPKLGIRIMKLKLRRKNVEFILVREKKMITEVGTVSGNSFTKFKFTFSEVLPKDR